jgi:hypothetical protein
MELKIPKFLIRKETKKQKSRDLGEVAFGREKLNQCNDWAKQKEKLYGCRHDVMLYDEAPKIGSGFRVVYVKEGRKWAHLTSQPGDPKTSDKVKTKLRMQTWKKILDRSRKRELTDV